MFRSFCFGVSHQKLGAAWHGRGGRGDDIKCLDLNLNVSSFILQILKSGQEWNVFKPLTFSTVLKCHLKPCLQIELCALGESLLLNISLYHVLIMKGLIEAIIMHIQRNLENLQKIFHSEDKFATLTTNVNNNKRMYWNDDLRKGAFQFIQADESQEYQPKAHEIVFNRSSANEPASMTWRYPEPRALTKIEVSPVPLQCNDEDSKKVITCYLQYWNSTYQEYVNFYDFVLSETEQFNLNLPDLNSDSVAVSTKWRVLLDCGSFIDDDGILEKENPYLSPLALAACMSIDSCFDPNLVPVFQTTTSFELVKIVLYNIFEKSDLDTTQRKHLQNFSVPTETVFCQEPRFFVGLRHFHKKESQLKMNLAADDPQFRKPLKMSLESGILGVQIVA
ncbi:vacuolar protein sorting-associated protein 13B [Trichonephila clavipes]|nr:vacuolar protein sorting-associated protein 13B [Trichonephila clavipes]